MTVDVGDVVEFTDESPSHFPPGGAIGLVVDIIPFGIASVQWLSTAKITRFIAIDRLRKVKVNMYQCVKCNNDRFIIKESGPHKGLYCGRGILEYKRPEVCTCHINPPCQACVDTPLV